MAISNVQLNNTFDQFRQTFNDAANAITALTDGGNSRISTNTVTANTFTANNLTSGRVALVGTDGLIQDDSGMTYNPTTDVLTLSGTTDSSTPFDGTLVVSGGVGIGKTLRVYGNTYITGNLVVLGANTELSTTQININDALLQLANNNTSDLVDIGIFGQYNQGAANLHTGFFRDSLDDTWKLFKSYNQEPTTKISTSANNFAYADLAVHGLSANNNVNVATGRGYRVNNVEVLNATTLGSSVVNVGTIASGTWCANFGTISGANLTNLNASNVTSGSIASARLGTGVANNTTFLRGDGAWVSPQSNVCSVTLVSGGEGIAGQFLKSQGPGQPSTWDLAITSYAYEDRGNLRFTTPQNGSQAYVAGLGYFIFETPSTESDDDETSFVTSNGAWILSAPTWDTIRAYTEFERVGRNYSVLVDNTIGTFTTAPVCQSVNIPGAAPNDFYQVQAYCGCDYTGEVKARYDNANGCVIIIGSIPRVTSTSVSSTSVSSGSASTSTTTTTTVCGSFSSVCKWLVYVQKV